MIAVPNKSGTRIDIVHLQPVPRLERLRISLHASGGVAASLSRDGRRLVFGGYGPLRIRDVDRHSTKTYRGYSAPPSGNAVSADARRLLTYRGPSRDHQGVLDVSTGRFTPLPAPPKGFFNTAFSISGNARWIDVQYARQNCCVHEYTFDTRTRKKSPVRRVQSYAEPFFTDDGSKKYQGGGIVDARTGAAIASVSLQGPFFPRDAAGNTLFGPISNGINGDGLLAPFACGKNLYYQDVATRHNFLLTTEGPANVATVRISRDGTRVFAQDGRGPIYAADVSGATDLGTAPLAPCVLRFDRVEKDVPFTALLGTGAADDYATPQDGGTQAAINWPTQSRSVISHGPAGTPSGHSGQFGTYAIDLYPFQGGVGTVIAGVAGVVVRSYGGCKGCGNSGYRNYVVIKTSDGTCQFIAGMYLGALIPPPGTTLAANALIGYFDKDQLHVDHVDCHTGKSLPWTPASGGPLVWGTIIDVPPTSLTSAQMSG